MLVTRAEEAFGAVGHLACNAGIDTIKSALEYTPVEWDRAVSRVGHDSRGGVS